MCVPETHQAAVVCVLHNGAAGELWGARPELPGAFSALNLALLREPEEYGDARPVLPARFPLISITCLSVAVTLFQSQ